MHEPVLETPLARRSIGIELSADYIKITRKRLAGQTTGMAL
jgi:DNA modification methylase